MKKMLLADQTRGTDIFFPERNWVGEERGPARPNAIYIPTPPQKTQQQKKMASKSTLTRLGNTESSSLFLSLSLSTLAVASSRGIYIRHIGGQRLFFHGES
jgi:hypothetical protein